jgi:nucleotide-binding universal stress UspA family protein
MGALGVGAVRDSVIRSVVERTVRRVHDSDFFLIKNPKSIEPDGPIVCALDGSGHSYGGLMTALALGKALNVPVEAISAFDPYFHYAMFNSIADVLSEEAGKVFRFKEQEKLHEEIIDSGLAKIYQAHLDIGKQVAQAEGMELKTTLLDGKAFERCLQYVKKNKPWLLVMGRIGVHSDDTMDIARSEICGSPLNILISIALRPADRYHGPVHIAWTEAAKRMEKSGVRRGVAHRSDLSLRDRENPSSQRSRRWPWGICRPMPSPR